MSLNDTVLLRDRHVKYWLRCSKTFLPEAYTSSDSSRMTLAFFIISALDLLNILDSNVEPVERDGWIDWIYDCQLDTGGFRGFTGPKIHKILRTPENQHWDPANVPATFFALATLVILGDDLSRVRREECLSWLPKLQRENGSFGETLGENESIEGGNDLRFCCCAAGIRRILLGYGDVEDLPAGVDLNLAIQYIEACQAYDGGFSEGSGHESHSGLTYCAIGSLAFLDHSPSPDVCTVSSTISFDDCAHWLVHRQTTYLEEEDSENEEQKDHAHEVKAAGSPPSPSSSSSRIRSSPESSYAEDTVSSTPQNVLDAPIQGVQALVDSEKKPPPLWAGFNGRPNKTADTCYCFWNTGALAMMSRLHLVDTKRMRNFLLEKTQHIIGGFGKGVGQSPDIMHAYLGLAALAMIGDQDDGGSSLPAMDPMFCLSVKARQNLKRVSWWT